MRILIAALAALLTLSCGRFGGLAPSSSTPVILISIDTLRSDRLPAYGYTGVSTPNIDALRKDSILYQRAYSHCPLTLPSHTSMLTGLLPSEHGVRDNVGYRLDAKVPTLPELLKKNGYATAGAISAFVLRRESGIARGFDSYDDQTEALGAAAAIGYVQRAGGDTIKAAQQWIDRNAGSPFFLFLHLYEPHTPYTPPEPFLSQYKNTYDGEIAYVDQLLGDFIADLQQRGLYDKAMIVLLSDHGEGLNDHGEEEHGVFLYREAIQVPLMVKMPKSAKGGETVEAPVQLIDVFPTILEQTKTPLPKLPNNARSLLAFLDESIAARPIYSETYYARLHFGWSDLHSLIEANDHYIHAPIPELYDIVQDPTERKNTYNDNRRASFRMRNAIAPLVKAASAPSQIDPEEVAKLAALGYVGSTVSTSEDEELPDPKTTIGTFRQIKIAFTLFRDLKLEECLELVDELLAANDKIVDIWDLKSKALAKLGRNEEAIEAAREGLKRQPNAVGLIMAVANLSIMTGELTQAEQHADLLLKTDPPRAHEIRARVAAQRNDYETAKKEAQLALKEATDPSVGLMTLGLIYKQQNELEPALEHFDKALHGHKTRKIPNLQFYRGDLLARLGRNREAETAFRAEIAEYPQQPEAYGSLILLLSSEGRVEEATQLVFKLVEAAPLPPSYVTISETLKAVGDDRGAVYWARQGVKKFPKHRVLQSLSRTFVVAG